MTFKELVQGIAVVTAGTALLLKVILPYVMKKNGDSTGSSLSSSTILRENAEALREMKSTLKSVQEVCRAIDKRLTAMEAVAPSSQISRAFERLNDIHREVMDRD